MGLSETWARDAEMGPWQSTRQRGSVPAPSPPKPGPEQSCLTSLYDSVGSDGLEIFSVKILDSSNKICAF